MRKQARCQVMKKVGSPHLFFSVPCIFLSLLSPNHANDLYQTEMRFLNFSALQQESTSFSVTGTVAMFSQSLSKTYNIDFFLCPVQELLGFFVCFVYEPMQMCRFHACN